MNNSSIHDNFCILRHTFITKKTLMSDYLQRSKDIWCHYFYPGGRCPCCKGVVLNKIYIYNGNFVYGNWNIKPWAISLWNVDTIHYNLYQFILTNMVILFKGSSWPRSHCNQCQSPSGNSRLTSYGAWRGIPNIPVCVLYLVRLLVILCQ